MRERAAGSSSGSTTAVPLRHRRRDLHSHPRLRLQVLDVVSLQYRELRLSQNVSPHQAVPDRVCIAGNRCDGQWFPRARRPAVRHRAVSRNRHNRLFGRSIVVIIWYFRDRILLFYRPTLPRPGREDTICPSSRASGGPGRMILAAGRSRCAGQGLTAAVRVRCCTFPLYAAGDRSMRSEMPRAMSMQGFPPEKRRISVRL